MKGCHTRINFPEMDAIEDEVEVDQRSFEEYPPSPPEDLVVVVDIEESACICTQGGFL